MPDQLEARSGRVARVVESLDKRALRHSRRYACRCGHGIYFDNEACPECGAVVGYLADEGRLAALDPGPEPGTWFEEGRAEPLKFCANRDSAAFCNWMLAAANPSALCISCRLTRAIPDLGDEDNARYWGTIEAAKRRMVSQLLALSLPVRSKIDEDPDTGVMFDFKRSPPGGPGVRTGHASGLITINVEEADDAKREKIKFDLHEPYRTLLGHFRHEVGHYFWDRLIWNTNWLEPYRQLFGDERASYQEALKRNYEIGPPPDWAESFISGYSTMHPWEDWAETWAHYMHIADSLGTALGFGMTLDLPDHEAPSFGTDALYAPDHHDAPRFLELLNGWLELTSILNELARSMGQPDFYPFTMSKPVVAKLQFVHIVVRAAQTRTDL